MRQSFGCALQSDFRKIKSRPCVCNVGLGADSSVSRWSRFLTVFTVERFESWRDKTLFGLLGGWPSTGVKH